MSLQNAGILAALIGLLVLVLTGYQQLGLTILIVGCVVAVIGIITRR